MGSSRTPTYGHQSSASSTCHEAWCGNHCLTKSWDTHTVTLLSFSWELTRLSGHWQWELNTSATGERVRGAELWREGSHLVVSVPAFLSVLPHSAQGPGWVDPTPLPVSLAVVIGSGIPLWPGLASTKAQSWPFAGAAEKDASFPQEG